MSICAENSSGSYHFALTQHLVRLAKEDGIPLKLDIYPAYRSDTYAASRAGFVARYALLGLGIESSHALEHAHIDSLHNSLIIL